MPISAKTGQGVPEILEAIVQKIPPPKGDKAALAAARISAEWSFGAMVRILKT